MMKRIGFCVLALCFIVGSAQAVYLPPGGGASPVPIQPPPSTVPIDVLVSPYSIGGTLTGTATSWVVAGDLANLYGGLSFYYQVFNTGTDYVSRFTASSFAPIPGMSVDVATIVDPWDGAMAGGVPSSDTFRSSSVVSSQSNVVRRSNRWRLHHYGVRQSRCAPKSENYSGYMGM
jgi:hypothetical protein